MQPLQAPQENALSLRRQLLCQEGVVHPVRRTVPGGQDDLPPEEAIGLVVKRRQRPVAEAEKAHIEQTLVALDAFALQIHLALGGDDGLDVVGFGQGAQIHIIVHH